MLSAATFVATLVLIGSSLAQESRPANASEGLRPGESVRETDAAFPGAEPLDSDGWQLEYATRIVDEWTREPIPGAVLRVPNHPNVACAPDDMFFLVEARADAEGWVRVPAAKLSGFRDYALVEAPGYAVFEGWSPGLDTAALRRGVDVPVRLLDFRGRPVPNARLGLQRGCGHIPPQRVAKTDENGMAVFRSIDPGRRDYVVAEAPTLARFTHNLASTYRPGGPPVEIHADPGFHLRGRVLRANGEPWPGLRVSVGNICRITKEDGAFLLPGATEASTLRVRVKLDEEMPLEIRRVPPAAVPMTIRIGKEEPRTRVELVCVGPEGEELDDVSVRALRRGDGWSDYASSDRSGRASFDVPRGEIEFVAGSILGPWLETGEVLRVGTEPPARVRLQLRAAPRLRVDASRILDSTVVIATAGARRKLSFEELESGLVAVPEHEPSTIRVSGRSGQDLLVRFFDVPPPERRGPDPLVLDWVPVKSLRARLVDPDGHPLTGSLGVVRAVLPTWIDGYSHADRSGPSRAPSITTRMTGAVTWLVEPEDERFVTRTGSVLLPSAAKDIDLGTIRLQRQSESPELRIQRAVGPECEAYQLETFLSPSRRWEAGLHEILAPRSKESIRIAGLQEGSLLSVYSGWSCLPTVLRLAGAPPYDLRIPGGSLTVRVFGEDGKPLEDPVLFFDGNDQSWGELGVGSKRVYRIPAGKHQLIVAHSDYRAKVFDLVHRPDEDRVLRVVLRQR